MFSIFVFTHSNKPMMIELAWGQFVFSNLLGGGNHKISIDKRFGHKCGPSLVPDCRRIGVRRSLRTISTNADPSTVQEAENYFFTFNCARVCV